MTKDYDVMIHMSAVLGLQKARNVKFYVQNSLQECITFLVRLFLLKQEIYNGGKPKIRCIMGDVQMGELKFR